MIRDLTKSMLSFSWAMSLFGMNQLVNSLAPEKATGAFNAVTRATEEQLGDMLKGAFRAGDQLQRGMVDLTFSAFRGAQRGAAGSQERPTGWGPVSPPGAY
jgi:hypothetical protein